MHWNVGPSVMRLLFETGDFAHVLRTVFFLLEPEDLLNASLVCKTWNEFLRAHVWTASDGSRRITTNWISRRPVARHVVAVDTDHCQNNNGRPVQALIPYGARIDMPRCLLADASEIIFAVQGTIFVYERSSGRLRSKLFVAEMDLQWHLVMSKRFLVGRQLSMHSDRIHLWDRTNAYAKLVMEPRGVPDHFQPHDMHMLGDDRVLCEVFVAGGGLAASPMAVYALKICPETLSFDREWTVYGEYDLVSVSTGGKQIIMCGKSDVDGSFRLRLLSADDGRVTSQISFETQTDHDIVKAVAYTKPVGLVVMCKSAEENVEGWISFKTVSSKILLFDLAHGFLLRSLTFDCAKHFGDLNNSCLRMWCDPPIGILLMAVRSKNTNCSKILAWNLLDLLRETENKNETEPDRVFETGGLAMADAIATSNHKLLYATVNKDNKVTLVDNDFWGKLL